MAVEQPKKVTGGAFGRYMAENRDRLLKECAGKPATASIQLGSGRFKALSETARAEYEKMYAAAKEKYEKDLAAFLAAGGEMKAKKAKKVKKEKKVKDPNKPKKPAGGAFGCFLAKHRAEFFKELGPGKAVTAVAKLASQRWKELGDTARKPFEEEFKVKQAQYAKEMKEYVPPAGAEDDDEEGEEGEDVDQEDEDEEEEAKDDAKVTASPKKRKADAPIHELAAKIRKKNAGVSDTVEAEAKKLGYHLKLKVLTENPKIKASPSEILAKLQEQSGSTVAAKKALLGG